MIRLLERNEDGTISLTTFDKDDDVPPYAILSHRWEREEVLFDDMGDPTAEGKVGFRKIQFCADQAWRDGLRFCWVDTCCIDKTNSVELQEAVTSMFRWYCRARKCYVYLADISAFSAEPPLRSSLWFTRGWTLQELIAPKSVEFFSREFVRLGDKTSLEQDIHDITGVPISVLRGALLSKFSVDKRMEWMDKRETTRPEDKAYALFGIFNVQMPLIYGEGRENAFKRLREVVAKDNAYLADLRLTDPRDDMHRIADTKGGLFRGASNWILEHADFRRWRDSDEARLLWIKGDPGKGKTMLLITIIEELDAQATAASSTALSYFFCQGTDNKLNNAAAVLRGLIYLLCEQQPCLASHLRARYESAGAKLFEDANTFYALSNVLGKIIHDDRLQQAYLVVDALDECVVDQDRLIRFIARHAASSRRVKWIVSSRNIPEIEELLQINEPGGSDTSGIKLGLEVTQTAEQVARAIDAFIDHKLSAVRALRDDHDKRCRVRDAMREKANGTFLWVALVAKELEKAKGWRVLHVVEKVPSTLEAFYDLMMARARQSDDGEWEYCRLVLSAATLAYRPLRLAELTVVSGLPADISGNVGYVRDIIFMCGSFLTVKDGIVYLIHQSVKDYLAGRAATTIFPSGLHRVHREIFARSLKAMSVLRRNIYGLTRLGVVIEDVKVPNPDPLYSIEYSCVHWASHFCNVGSDKNGIESGDLEMIGRFIRRSFLYWLEAIALLRSMSKSIASLRQLQTFLEEAKLGEIQQTILVKDAVRFALHNRHTIENAPLQTYVSALLFSPVNSFIRREFGREEPLWVKPKPLVETNWSPCVQTLEGHKSWVDSVAFSTDGRHIVSGSSDMTIKTWDAQTGECIQTLEGHRADVKSVAFSPDGRHIISGSNDRTVRIWDAQTGACLQTLKGHSWSVDSVEFSPDGRHIISGSYDNAIKIWDAQTGACVQTLEGHSGPVASVAFSADGRHIVSGSDDKTIKIWDAREGSCIQTLEGHSSWVKAVAFSADGRHIVSGSGDITMKIWDARTGACIRTLEGHSSEVRSVAFSADDRHIVSGAADWTIKIWDWQTGACIQTLAGHRSWVTSAAFSADGRHIVSGSDGGIKIWDAQTSACTQKLEGDESWVCSVAFSADGRHIVSGSEDNAIKIWDAQTGECVQTLEGHGRSVCSAAFSADGRHIVSGSEDRTIKIWDAQTGECVQTLKGHIWGVQSVAFSADGRHIVSGSRDRAINIWDAQTGACVQMLEGHNWGTQSVAFSADGRNIVSGSYKTIKIWDVQTGTCVQTLEGHSEGVYSAVFSADGRHIVSGSADLTMKIWDAKTGVCEQTLGFPEMVKVITANASERGRMQVFTNRGWIVVHVGKGSDNVASETQSQHATERREDTRSHGLGYGLSPCGRWIRWCDENLIWLPVDYWSTITAVWGGSSGISASPSPSPSPPCISTVAIGRWTGQVVILGLSEPVSTLV